MSKPTRLLKTKEAAEFVGHAPQTLVVWRCTKAVQIPYLKIGGSVRYREEDLIAFLENSRVQPIEAR